MLTPLQPAAFLTFFAASRFMHFFTHLGLLGLFLVSIVDSSFVPLPVPGVTDIMIVLFAAHHSNVIWLVLVATAGSALGGLLSHMVGQAGGMAFLEKHVPPRILGPVTRWMQSHALLAVALPAILPPPAPLSPFVLAAGALNMSRKRFMIAFTVSRFVRHAIAAWLGVHYGRGVLHLWRDITARWGDAFLISLWSVILLFSGYAFFKLYRTSLAGRRQGFSPICSQSGNRFAAETLAPVDALVNSILCRVLRDAIPPTPPGPEGSNGNGPSRAQ